MISRSGDAEFSGHNEYQLEESRKQPEGAIEMVGQAYS